jgi:hypothetical protein
MRQWTKWLNPVALLVTVSGSYYVAEKARQKASWTPRLEVLTARSSAFSIPKSHYRLVAADTLNDAGPPTLFVELMIHNPSQTAVENAEIEISRDGVYETVRGDGEKASATFHGKVRIGKPIKPHETVRALLWLDGEGGLSAPPTLALRYVGGSMAVNLTKERIPWANLVLACFLLLATVFAVAFAMATAVTFVALRGQLDRLTNLLADEDGRGEPG